MSIQNFIDGTASVSKTQDSFEKIDPHTGSLLYEVTISGEYEVDKAITSGQLAFLSWSKVTPVERGKVLGQVVQCMREHQNELAQIISSETGKSAKDSKGEVLAGISQGEFFAGEGMRLFGRSLNSGMENKQTFTVREPHGVSALIVPANTPLANITWKVFPALICGNSAILKASEDAPKLAIRFAEIARDAGLPSGVLNVLQGKLAGPLLVEDNRIKLISFTGSTAAGRSIAKNAGARLARVSLELGGKNPFIVCNDADIDNALQWATLSAFSNAGQRCSSGSRILIQSEIYDIFVERLVEKTKKLKLGICNDADLGPVISKRQQQNILAAIEEAKSEGGIVLAGGKVPDNSALAKGCYVSPTLVANLSHENSLPNVELFGPVATLHSFRNLDEAILLSNSTDYGLTAAIHTKDIDRGLWFAKKVRAGSANINIATYGSEPHMPFGGFGDSGNGTREPGTEAIDVYSELKCISILVRPNLT